LLTAHHLDDQAETFLMRLARGSGVDGLASMAREVRRYGVTIHRPLLDVPRAALLNELKKSGWEWVDDPANRDRKFERARLRAHEKEMKKLGLSADKICLSARRLRRARQALESIRDSFLAENAIIGEHGLARIDQLALADAPFEIARRAMGRLLRICGGGDGFSSLARLERLTERLRDDFATNRTLAGCRIISRGDFWLIVREAGRIEEKAKPVAPGECVFWDNRYIVCSGRQAPRGILAGPLLDSEPPEAPGDDEEGGALRKMPREAMPSLLTFRLDGGIIAIPALEYWSEKAVEAELAAKFITSDDGLV
jgi:tRNA(Ile)-lysidine synthase